MSNVPLSSGSPGGDRVVELLILWGEHSVLHAAHLRPSQRFVVGDPEASAEPIDFTLAASLLGAPSLALLDADDGASRVQLPPGATGTLARAGQLTPLAAGAALRLEPNDQLGFAWQGFQVQVRELEPSEAAELHAAPRWQLKDHRWTLGSLAFHSLFLALFQFLPSAAASLNMDESALESRLVKTFMAAQSVEPPEPLFTPEAGDASAEGGERAAEDEGQAGDPKHARTKNRSSGAATPPSTAPTRAELKELASLMGINQVLRSVNGPTANLFSDRPQGVQEGEALLGALAGAETGANFGFGGLGAIGSGRGGGGAATGTIGVGGPHTRGGIGFGRPGGGLREPVVHGGPTIKRLPPEVMGGLSREVIRRVIGRHLNEVRHCYEQGLRTRPELQGRVTVKFAIGTTGSVVTAVVAQNELGDAQVAQCISAATRRWQFPAPEGSGMVMVSYPFLLEQP
jgi:hypothetical protein